VTFARPRSAVRSASLARGCRYARRGCNRGMAHHPARQVDRPRSANACAEPRSGVTTSAGCTTDGLRPWNRSGNPRHPVGHQEGPAVEALTPASPDSLPPLGDLIADEPFWRYPAGATGRALPTSAGGSPRIPSPATWPWSPRPAPPPGSPSLRSTSGPLSPAGTGPRLSCSSTSRHRRPGKAGKLSTWSASVPTAARTGRTRGRLRRRIPAVPGSSCGWPSTGTGSSAGRPARVRPVRG
jgi:hypothetical protein